MSVVGAGLTAQYEYDHAGMLVAGVDVVAAYDEAGAALAHYMYGHGLAARREDGFGYVGLDAIANTALLSDGSGTPLDQQLTRRRRCTTVSRGGMSRRVARWDALEFDGD